MFTIREKEIGLKLNEIEEKKVSTSKGSMNQHNEDDPFEDSNEVNGLDNSYDEEDMVNSDNESDSSS